MTFPNISFFFKVNTFYSDLMNSFLYNYYFKLHNILFTNLYIRIYRYKLVQLNKKNKYISKRHKYNKNMFLDKTKNKKKQRSNMTSIKNNNSVRFFSVNSFFLFNKVDSSFSLENNRYNKFSNNKYKQKKKRGYVFINKFKDCGNQYDFDPFYPYLTYKLNDFDFYRAKKLKKQKPLNEKKVFDLSVFDARLKHVNTRTFNESTFNLILEIYKKQKTNKTTFLYYLKNNISFFYNFIFFFKKRILYIKTFLFKFKRKLLSYVYKLNFISHLLSNEKSQIDFFIYLKNKNFSFFSLYNVLVEHFLKMKSKYNNYYSLFTTYKGYYFTFLNVLKKKHSSLKVKKNEKQNLLAHFRNVSFYEKVISNVATLSHKLMHFKGLNTSKWEKQNAISSLFVSINKYITLYRSLFKDTIVSKYLKNNAIIYIKATATNVFLYFIYNNKILYKKTCGELVDIKKKERRFWRNVYPLVESFLPFVMKAKNEFRFPFVSLYLNGSSSLCTPLLSSVRKHNKKFRKILYFLFNEFEFLNNKTLELKEKFRGKYIFYPIYRLKLFSIFDGFYRLSKIYFAVNKIKDITSWPYNGCKKKKKKNVR